MADTVRSLSALQTLLADNTSGDISPQDLRDFLVSVYPITGSNLMIESQLLAADQATISFVDIPQVYTDLQLIILARGTTAGDLQNLMMRFGNGAIDAGANYDGFSYQIQDGASVVVSEQQGVTSVHIARGIVAEGNDDPAAFSAVTVSIPGYRGATRKAFTASTSGAATADVSVGSNRAGGAVGLWRNIAAITHIDVFPGGDLLAAGSRFSLYGLGHTGN